VDPRPLLWIAPGSSAPGLLPTIGSAGWRIYLAQDLNKARQYLGQRRFGVGLAEVDSRNEEQIRGNLDALCRADDYMAWVALLTRESLGNSDTCRTIWESFYDFHTLPVDVDRLLATLGHAHGMASLGRSAMSLAAGQFDQLQMVAVSPAMLAVFRAIRRISTVDAPVLITGESGTGKELAAQAIHGRSRRSGAPFIAVNCAALPATLIQSELFGHEKGAFTGAVQRKIGRIEAANGGTLFLDEIGDLSRDLQVNLLRFLQESTIQRVGSSKPIPVDARVIAATHVDLEELVAGGRFREDLYYRLNVLRLKMPPVRDRGQDVEVLARYFFAKFSQERGHNIRGFSRGALQAMAAHSWPGNVREIINRVRRAMVMCDGRSIRPGDLDLDDRSQAGRSITLEEALGTAEQDAISQALKITGANLSEAARRLDVSRPRLYRLIEKYGLTPKPPASG